MGEHPAAEAAASRALGAGLRFEQNRAASCTHQLVRGGQTASAGSHDRYGCAAQSLGKASDTPVPRQVGGVIERKIHLQVTGRDGFFRHLRHHFSSDSNR
jgi:hypothetical protein